VATDIAGNYRVPMRVGPVEPRSRRPALRPSAARVNRTNYDPTNWVKSLGNLTTYDTPGACSNIQYYPRMAQFGFRATF
jgi:hypothetical protein